MRPVVVVGRGQDESIIDVLASQVALAQERSKPQIPLFVARRGFLSAVGRYGTIIVLCVSDEQVIHGHTPFRVLGEMLFSKRIVLIGPQVVKDWRGGFGIFYPRRAWELAALVVVAVVSVVTTITTLTIVALYDVLSRAGLLR